MNPINPTLQNGNSPSLKRSFAPVLALFGIIFGALGVSQAASFTPGNVVVYRVGNGTSEILVNTGNSIFLDEFTPAGSLVQSIAIPNSGSNAVIASGTSTSEGMLSRSGDGQFLVVTGYNTAVPYTSSVSSSTSATVNRAVAIVNTSGAVASTTKFSDWANANNPRSAVTNDGTQLWLGGAAGGVRYVSSVAATTGTQISTPAGLVNMRQVAIFDGQLYATTNSGAGSNTTSIGTVGSGLPTTSAAYTTLSGIAPAGTITGTSRYAFFFADLSAGVAGVDTLYIADDGVLALSKYSRVGSNWVLNNTIGVDADDYRGVTGTVSGSTVTLFATRKGGASNTGGGELVKIIDASGYNASISATPSLLASAIVGTATAPNTSFRGVAIAPGNVVALPSVNLSVSASTGTEAGTTAITVTATASAAVTGDQTVSLAVTGTGITAGDYTLSNSTITILNGATTGTVTFTVTDDALAEVTETATLTISNPSSGIALGATTAQNVDITDNDSPPAVNLSVSASTGTEAESTVITVTATASAAVTGDQTVSLAVTGTDITAGDYSLSNATITILSGATTGSVTFTVVDDVDVEATETATLTISGPSAGITLGATTAQNIVITDNDAPLAAPTITVQPTPSQSVAYNATATLTVAATGNPTPTFQWYQGISGDTSTPVGTASSSFTTPALTTNTSYWVRASNSQGSADSDTAAITVTLSNVSSLSALTLSSGTLAPTFASGTFSYTASVTNAASSITVTPTKTNTYATIEARVNGGAYASVTSGSPSSALALDVGSNTVDVKVTAQDGVATSTYTVTVTRRAPNLATGAIAFTGFNADGNDDIAFVALTAIPGNAVIYFTDNEWNGSPIGSGGAFNDFNESEWMWTAPVDGVAAGTVVTINNINTTTTTSVGTVAFTDSANRGLSTSGDAVYAFQGSSHTAEVFLAEISSDAAASIVNSGLTAGSTAVVLSASSDGARYKGSRSNQTTFAGYLSLIGNVATNWDDIANGDGTTYLPFNTAAFTLSSGSASVNLSVSASTGTEAAATVITVTATASAAVSGDQTVSLAVTGTGITAGDYTLSNATITILDGQTTGTVTFTVVNDVIVEGTETATLTISSPSAGLTLGSTTAQNVAIDDDDVITVNLAVSANTGTEAAATVITVTATASGPVTGDQTVNVAVTGTGITAGDYTLSNATITILDGQTTGTVTFTIVDDAVYEGTETATLTISSPTAGITLGTTLGQDVAITDNDPASSGPYSSANRDILAANTTTWSPAGVTVNGTTFVNLGLQGVGRVPASTIDSATGETLGSVSDMQISKWRKNGDGSYSGTFNFLPDRGYNSGSIYSNYAARLNNFDFTFTPYTSSAITGLQNQIAMTFTGSERFTYDHDANSGTAAVYTTGLNATGTATLFGTTVPTASGNSTQSDGTVNNRLTLDSEGLVLDKRTGKVGAGWIGDEYGASVYHFNSAKQIDGQLILPAALIPHKPATNTRFDGTPDNGRRDNQGIEGIAQSPDGTRLFVLLQSATVQDSGSGNQGRSNTRLLVYDVSSTDTPTDPIDQYVIRLPRVDTDGNLAVDRTAAQSAIIALNDQQLLILSRDGNGRGASGAPVFKSVLLADLSTATDIDGTYDAEAAQVSPGGTLSGSITPLNWTEALNLIGKLDLSVTEVEQFGLNLNAAPGDINSICEKWEALSLVSANDPAFPNDYFLFVGNDNDFVTSSIKYLDAAGTVQTAVGALENDTVVLAFRVRMTGTFNQAPFVPNSLVDQAATATTAFSYTFAANSFADPESGTLSYVASRLDDSALPAWLSFNPATRSFSGTPTGADVGSLLVKVTATDNGSPALATSACFTITVGPAPLTPIETWRQFYFNTTANSGLTADDADFDGDGVLNLMEYALGSNPTLTSGNHGQAALPVGVLNDSGDPLLSDRYSLSFTINSPAPTDLTYTVEAGDDLENWTPVAQSTGDSTWAWLAGGTAHTVVGTPSAGRVTIKVGDLVPQAGNPKRVMRLKVSK